MRRAARKPWAAPLAAALAVVAGAGAALGIAYDRMQDAAEREAAAPKPTITGSPGEEPATTRPGARGDETQPRTEPPAGSPSP